MLRSIVRITRPLTQVPIASLATSTASQSAKVAKEAKVVKPKVVKVKAATAAVKTTKKETKASVPSHINPNLPASEQDKLLFTPGPLTTSWPTKLAATRDLGSRDIAFRRVIVEVCNGLLEVAGVSSEQFTTVPIQGSGTFGVEGVLSSVIPKAKGLLLIANGAYGLRMGAIAKAHGINHTILDFPDNLPPDLAQVEKALQDHPEHTHVAVVQSETTSGIVNDIETIGRLVKKYNRSLIVDAMSSFGAYPLDFEAAGVDYLVSSANKCIEGIPGFTFAICRKSALDNAKLNGATPSSLSLDIIAQRNGLDKDGQFRFTPPTTALLAFRQALQEHKDEGGVTARGARYQANQKVLQAGLAPLGFELYLAPENQGYIISSYKYPTDPNWDFTSFYTKLNDLGFVIYPGKVSKTDCFRIGHIGRIFPEDTANLVKAITSVCKEMKTASFYKAPKAKATKATKAIE